MLARGGPGAIPKPTGGEREGNGPHCPLWAEHTALSTFLTHFHRRPCLCFPGQAQVTCLLTRALPRPAPSPSLGPFQFATPGSHMVGRGDQGLWAV